MCSLMLTAPSTFAAHPLESTPRQRLPPTLPTHYAVNRLVTSLPDPSFTPTKINHAGQVIGNTVKPRRFEGAAWSAVGGCISLLSHFPDPPVCAENAWPFSAISSNGLVAGMVSADVSKRRA
jgi:hypothetical protein